MRIVTPSMAFGAALIFLLSGGALFAQDQPAAGAPPSAAQSQATSGSQTNDAQPGNAQTNQAQPGDAQPGDAQPGDAQPNRTPNPEREAKSLAKRLALSPEQESAIEPVLAERQQKIEKARSNAALPPRARRARLQQIQRESDNKIEAVLTDTQRRQYEQLKQERRADRQMRRQQQAGAPPVASNQ